MAYYGVKKVIEHGKNMGPAQEKQPMIAEDSKLIGIMNDRTWAIAVSVTRESEYNHFYIWKEIG